MPLNAAPFEDSLRVKPDGFSSPFIWIGARGGMDASKRGTLTGRYEQRSHFAGSCAISFPDIHRGCLAACGSARTLGSNPRKPAQKKPEQVRL